MHRPESPSARPGTNKSVFFSPPSIARIARRSSEYCLLSNGMSMLSHVFVPVQSTMEAAGCEARGCGPGVSIAGSFSDHVTAFQSRRTTLIVDNLLMILTRALPSARIACAYTSPLVPAFIRPLSGSVKLGNAASAPKEMSASVKENVDKAIKENDVVVFGKSWCSVSSTTSTRMLAS